MGVTSHRASTTDFIQQIHGRILREKSRYHPSDHPRESPRGYLVDIREGIPANYAGESLRQPPNLARRASSRAITPSFVAAFP
jgi:hypothetical protein